MTPFQTSLKNALETLQGTASLEPLVERAVVLITEALLAGNKLLFCGNGGSAADAAHMATEFVCRFKDDRKGYPALALGVDGGLLTAVANDYAFHKVFSRQVQALGRPGDILIGLTTSGKSQNILEAIEEGRRSGLRTIVFLGKGGGFTKGAAELELLISGEDTARIQEAQKFLLHVICESVDTQLPKE